MWICRRKLFQACDILTMSALVLFQVNLKKRDKGALNGGYNKEELY